jgi:hypothetical protein
MKLSSPPVAAPARRLPERGGAAVGGAVQAGGQLGGGQRDLGPGRTLDSAIEMPILFANLV